MARWKDTIIHVARLPMIVVLWSTVGSVVGPLLSGFGCDEVLEIPLLRF